MALPESYDDQTLAAYMAAVLGPVATAMSYDVESSYAETINDVLVLYGVADLNEATDIDKLRSAARLAVWRMVAAHTAGKYDIEVDDETMDRSQMHKHALAMVKQERTAAMRHGIEYDVEALPIHYIHDPYAALTDEERTAV